MSDSNNTVLPVAPATLTAPASDVPPSPVGATPPPSAPQQPQAPPQAPPTAVSYKDLLLDAHKLGVQNNQNIFRTAIIMEELTEKMKKLENTIGDIRQQIAAIFILSDESQPITSTNAATKIVEAQTKALRKQIDNSVAKGMILAQDTINKVSDIIWYSFDDGGLGYQSVAALPADQQVAAIGKKVGDKIGDLKVEEIYSLVEKPNPGTGAQNGQQTSPVQDPNQQNQPQAPAADGSGVNQGSPTT